MYLKPTGHSVIVDEYGNQKHNDTFTCKHCQQICDVEPNQHPDEFWCQSCMAPICKRCKAIEWRRPPGACLHFERQLDIAESKYRFNISLSS